MPDLKTKSPNAVYTDHCKAGELAYQVDLDTGKAVFYPRIIAPGSGSARLEWRVSKGLGTVYATTATHYKGEAPLNIALIDVDEGFRMMSRVEGIEAMKVTIGMRVKVKIIPGDDKQLAYPVFTPLEA